MKKSIVWLLCAVMLIGALAGCVHFSLLIAKMLMFTLVISCSTTSNLP